MRLILPGDSTVSSNSSFFNASGFFDKDLMLVKIYRYNLMQR